MRFRHFACLFVILLAPYHPATSQVCALPPAAGTRDALETALVPTAQSVVITSSECPYAGLASCTERAALLAKLQINVLGLTATDMQCSVSGVTAAGTPLTAAQKKLYLDRASRWSELYNDMSQQTASITNGTYQLPLSIQQYLFDLKLAPALPAVTGSLSPNTTQLTITGQAQDANYKSSDVYVCVWNTRPASASSANCLSGTTPPAALVLKTALPPGSFPHITLDQQAKASITLKNALHVGQFVSLVQISTPVIPPAPPAPGQITMVSAEISGVPINKQCNTDPVAHPYSDCDLLFSMIAGVEQAGLSSESSTTDGFLRIYSQSAAIHPDFAKNVSLNSWGVIRFLSAPQQNSTSGVISAFTNPDGSIQTNTISSVGTSIDYMIGLSALFEYRQKGTTSIIAGFGATTPLSSSTLAEAFIAPAFGTVECNTLYGKFKKYFATSSYNILLGSANQATPTYPATTASSCLLNGNDPSTNSSLVTTYAPITTIAFSNQDRNDFLQKWEIGLRGIYRYLDPDATACGDWDPALKIAPCQRGMIDFTIGQDASITGGELRNWVLKVDGVQPVPIKGEAFIYLFGSFSMRFVQNVNDTPLILQAGSTSSLSGTGPSSVPNVNTVVLPLVQPDRDFYRFGVGLDLTCLLSKVFTANKSCGASQSSSSSSNSASTGS